MLRTTRKPAIVWKVTDYGIWITGAANFTDGDPNTSPPAPGRIITPPSRMDRQCQVFTTVAPPNSLGSGMHQACHMADGTSATVRQWWYDDTIGKWLAHLNAGTAMTFAGNNVSFFGGIVLPGMKCFAQIVANVGCTKFAHFFR